MIRPRRKSRRKRVSNPRSSAPEADALTTRPTRRSRPDFDVNTPTPPGTAADSLLGPQGRHRGLVPSHIQRTALLMSLLCCQRTSPLGHCPLCPLERGGGGEREGGKEREGKGGRTGGRGEREGERGEGEGERERERERE